MAAERPRRRARKTPGDAPQASAIPPLTEMAAEPLQAFMQWTAQSPEFMQMYLRYLGQGAELWRQQVSRAPGAAPAATGQAAPVADRRFSSDDWASNPYFDFLRQSYLLTSQFLTDAVEAADLGDHDKGQLRFFSRQYLDAIAPSNFAATNPEAIRAALDSKGETMRQGVAQLIADIGRGRISTVDESAFEVGGNLALSPGEVVHQNDLFQLIQYRPSTARVHERPLLIVPPCINKFYILDLAPENTFIGHLVAQGHTVFIVSWRNPVPGDTFTVPEGAPDAGEVRPIETLGWDDYVEHGVIEAIHAVLDISRQETINLLGFCVGGTLLSSTLAVMAARGEKPAESLTLLATLLDFTDTGEIGFFVDEKSVAGREAAMGEGGLLLGRELAQVFSMLRDNDLIWSYVVNNYLKGQKPAAFDILFWNNDSTNLPGPMYTWYLRHMYLENRLRDPGSLTICGEPVDLGSIGAPLYLVATIEDHIVPWRSAYASAELLAPTARRRKPGRGGAQARGTVPPPRFVLGASGHIAGIINPASKNKRNYRVGKDVPANPDAWFEASEQKPGSWWNDWTHWLGQYGGPLKAAPRQPGDARHRPIEPAPGQYVLQKVD
jgi:polyhydroxyalkanoate synthase